MEITRRRFNIMILSVAALCVAGVRWFAGSMADKPARFLKALKPSSFPGRLRPLDEAEVRTEGKWRG